jgi:MFS family permease
MKKIAFVVAAASLFAFTPFAARFGPVVSSVALVWFGVVLALFASAASGASWSLAIGTGALGAFGGGVLATVSPAAAGAVLVAAAFTERTIRVRSRTARAVHVLIALVGGALAGSLSSAYTGASLPVFGVAATVAAVLSALPLLVEADDPVAHALDQAAEVVSEPAKRSLAEGAELRRNAEEVTLDRPTAARVKSTWQSLLRLAEARVRLERSRPRALVRIATATATVAAPPAAPAAVEAPTEGPPEPSPTSTASVPATTTTPSAADTVLVMVDQRIAEHVSVLARAYTAVDTVSAARVGLDDSALKNVESMGESLDDVSRALVEVRGERLPGT